MTGRTCFAIIDELAMELKHLDTGTYNIHLYGQSYVQPESTGTAERQFKLTNVPSEEEQPLSHNVNPKQGTYTVKNH